MKDISNLNPQKPKAVGYMRVATLQQNGSNNNNLKYQQEMLQQYCDIKGIELVKSFSDCSSGANFDRPGFKDLKEYFRINHKGIKYLLVQNWNRLGRNQIEMLACIKRFKKWGIEINVVEQSLDVREPKHKIRLALYLISPNVVSDKRVQRISDGMRTAIKKGRWVSSAPAGYEFVLGQNGIKILAPVKDNTSVMVIQAAFMKYSTGKYNLPQLKNELRKKFGLNLSLQGLAMILRNKIYAGFIAVKRTTDECGIVVKGLHKPLVSKQIFNKVQKILAREKKKP